MKRLFMIAIGLEMKYCRIIVRFMRLKGLALFLTELPRLLPMNYSLSPSFIWFVCLVISGALASIYGENLALCALSEVRKAGVGGPNLVPVRNTRYVNCSIGLKMMLSETIRNDDS